jgi:hypothetical protein
MPPNAPVVAVIITIALRLRSGDLILINAGLAKLIPQVLVYSGAAQILPKCLLQRICAATRHAVAT